MSQLTGLDQNACPHTPAQAAAEFNSLAAQEDDDDEDEGDEEEPEAAGTAPAGAQGNLDANGVAAEAGDSPEGVNPQVPRCGCICSLCACMRHAGF